MFKLIRKFKLLASFANARRADYSELASLEWADLSHALVRAVVAGVAALVGSVFFLTFLSVAVIVSAWDSDWRVLTAWLVATAWLVVLAGGGWTAFAAVRGLQPFRQVRDEIGKDMVVVRAAL